MKIVLLCKRRYTNKDLMQDHFGRLFHLPKQLAALGAEVSVLALDYRGITAELQHVDGVSLQSIPALPFSFPASYLYLRSFVKNVRPDIIIASGDSHIGYLGGHLAKLAKSSFVFDVYDYYPAFVGNRIPGMKAMFRHAVRRADLVIVASDSLCLKLAELNRRCLVVENGVEQALFCPGDKLQARHRLGVPVGVPTIGYFGSITPTRGPLLIEACRLLRESMPTLRLLLSGRVTGVKLVEDWIDYRGELPQAEIPGLIQACDVVAIPYGNDTFNSMAGACKIAEYLACSVPVVATNVSNHAQLFAGHPAALCDVSALSMAEALRRQLSEPVVVPFPESMSWASIGLKLHERLATLQ